MLFSILIAHYNNYNYFLDCYKSILQQSYQNFEVVIVDDCSTDGSFEKIKELTKNDSRFVLFRNETNKGVGSTKRKCAELATGEICGFVDPDDALVQNALEISLKNYNGNNVVAYSSFMLCDQNLKLQKPFPHSRAIKNKDKFFFNVLLEANHFFTFKKSAYDKTSGINPELTSAVDQDLYLKLYEIGNFKFINEPLYLYRLHANGISQNSSKKTKLSENWQLVILNTLERRDIKTLYGKNIDEIDNLPGFILKKTKHFLKKNSKKTSEMDLIIKSFNRPFYLDRCIASIYRYISGNVNIIVLDDGTPKKYLDKILEKYPKVDIRLSYNYDKKLNAIEENLKSGKSINGFEIPTRFWYENVEKSSQYVIVTEDDVWFTNPVNVEELQKEAQRFDINLIKLGWLGNEKDSENLDLKSISETLDSALPKNLLLFPKPLMKAFFTNQFKVFTILYKLGKVDHKTQRKYWALNSILMGFFNKNYWLNIWNGMDGKVDEKKQLLNASLFYKKNKNNQNFISRLKQEAMKTTFQSSATNSYHEYGFDFDVNQFNHIINEAWLKGDFDEMENFPKDFSTSYFKSFVSDQINIAEFEKWKTKFQTQYQILGCNIE